MYILMSCYNKTLDDFFFFRAYFRIPPLKVGKNREVERISSLFSFVTLVFVLLLLPNIQQFGVHVENVGNKKIS